MPVVARDAQSRAVGNLTKENFQVFDNGKAQAINGFMLVKREGAATGFLTDSPDAGELKSKVLDVAARGNVVISSIDTRGVYTTNLDAGGRTVGGMDIIVDKYRQASTSLSEHVMAELADGTGGTFYHNHNDGGGVEPIVFRPRVHVFVGVFGGQG